MRENLRQVSFLLSFILLNIISTSLQFPVDDITPIFCGWKKPYLSADTILQSKELSRKLNFILSFYVLALDFSWCMLPY